MLLGDFGVEDGEEKPNGIFLSKSILSMSSMSRSESAEKKGSFDNPMFPPFVG